MDTNNTGDIVDPKEFAKAAADGDKDLEVEKTEAVIETPDAEVTDTEDSSDD